MSREVAAYKKRKTVKYFQFPQRPETQGRPYDDEDQTDPFMFRTNTRLSFRPLMSTPVSSRYVERVNTGRLERRISFKKSDVALNTVPPQMSHNLLLTQNYQHFRPPAILTKGAFRRSPRYILF